MGAMLMLEQTEACDGEAALDDLIRRWHLFASREDFGLGYPVENVTCKLYRTSRQHDDQNGALDTDANAILLTGVGHCIERMVDPWRTAIYINARNLAIGLSVWTSARLPADDMARAIVVAEARTQLLRLLQSDGLA